MHFLLWAKESHQTPNFDTFKCSRENLPNSSCHFSNHKSVFLQILHYSSVSCKITPLYFFGQTLYILRKRNQSRCNFFLTFGCLGQNSPNSCLFLKQQISFFASNFASLFSVMRRNSSALF